MGVMAEAQTRLSEPPEAPHERALPTDRVREVLRNGYDGPFLLVDPDIIREKYRRFVAAMPRVRVHYAVKANPDPRVVRLLAQEGSAFEMASAAELDLVLECGGDPEEVHFSNPVKPVGYIRHAANGGVRWFALDSVDELRKIHGAAPDARMYLRLEVPDYGSDWPLSGKFGVSLEESRPILEEAQALGADLCGITFHVGSQCRNLENWTAALEKAKKAFALMGSVGLRPRLLNIGGGFPVQLTKPIPAIETIAQVINAGLADLPDEIRVMAEPGRYLVSDSACFVCQVIGISERNGQRWMFLDSGMFGGLFEATQGLEYPLETDRSGPNVPWHVAGPTCDSVDVLMQDQMLPADVQTGDFLYIHNAGAYTTAYASAFNGFPLPPTRVL